MSSEEKDKAFAYLEKMKEASKAIEAVDRIDKYIDMHVANAHDMKDSDPDKKYYRGWDDALGKIVGILQDVYSEERQKEQDKCPEYCVRSHCLGCSIYEKRKEQKSNLVPKIIRPKFAVGDTVCRDMWSDHTIREIYIDCDDPTYICINEEGIESHISFSEQDEWERKENKPVEWAELQSEFKNINEAFENGKKEVVAHPEKYGLCKSVEWSKENEDTYNRVYCLFRDAIDEWYTAIFSGCYPRITRDKVLAMLKSLHSQPISQPNINHTVWHNASEEKPTRLPIIHVWYHGNRVNAVVAHENIGLQRELGDINFQPDDKWAYVEDLLNVQPS